MSSLKAIGNCLRLNEAFGNGFVLALFALPNTACTERLGHCAFFELFPEFWQFFVFKASPPQPPVAHTVRT